MGNYSKTGRIILLLLVMMLIIFDSCKPTPRQWEEKTSEPAGLLTKDQMISLLIDIHLAEGDAQEKSLEPTHQRELLENHYKAICDIHSVTMDQIRTSYDYYVQKPLTMNEIYEKVISGLKKIEGEVEAR